ncbi:MAG: DUF2207 domain-containing protein [Elusimicrobiales bacterium]|nr:DUF2207 domain-containing protein [Elusimicrobiales bacterium]
MKRFFLLITFCFFCLAASASPAEKIERFDSFAVVNEDSSVSVTETIAVRSDGDKIRRGIFRVLPYKGVSDYKIISVSRDGKAEPYTVKKSSSAKTVYIGDSDRILPPGRYVYELSYIVKGAVRFQKEFDEFYWNVTGNDWQFPILFASFRWSLPAGAEVGPGGVSYYTGAVGEKGQDAYIPGGPEVDVTRPLSPGEGFTVSVAWNKGVVKEPSFVEKIFSGPAAWFFCVWLLLQFYYVCVWRWVGKDPEARVLRRFTPPDGLSPGQVRYVRLMNWDAQLLSVIILSLVRKGYIEVKKAGKRDFTLVRLMPSAGVPLPPEEQAYLDELFKEKDCIEMDNKFVDTFQSADAAACDALDTWAGRRFFSRNTWYKFPRYLFVVGWIVFIVWYLPLQPLGGDIVASGVIFLILSPILDSIFQVFRLNDIPLFELKSAAILTMLLGWRWGVLSVVAFAPGCMFSYLVPAYTSLGRQKMDEIEGFKEYLEVAETNRVFASNPTDAARIYCDYLPYAVALDVQNEWWNAFERELGQASAEQAVKIELGNVGEPNAVGGLMSALMAASASSSNSSSDSGFGGGGCSGGGSGGGGGGGW